MGKERNRQKNTQKPKLKPIPKSDPPPTPIIIIEEEPTMTDQKPPVDPIDNLVETIHTKIREPNAQEIVGRLIFEQIFSKDTEVLNPWQLYTNTGKKTYNSKYANYDKLWNSIVDKLSYMDIDQLRRWYRIEACKEVETELRQEAKSKGEDVVATFDWNQKRIDEILKGSKGKNWIRTKIINWLDLKDVLKSGKKTKSTSVSPLEKLEKKIVGIEKVVNDSFLWKRLVNPKTFDGMPKKKTDEMIDILTKAADRLSGLAKGAENAVMLRNQLAEK